MTSKSFAYIWEYAVVTQLKAEFLEAYSPDGEWAKLMAKHAGYRGTKLLQDATAPDRFVTIDHWASKADRDEFRAQFSSDYEKLDKKCERLMQHESFIGDFLDINSLEFGSIP